MAFNQNRMKYLAFLVTIAGISLAAFTYQANQAITGVVKDGETGEGLLGATLKLMKDDVFVQGTVTDAEGKFRIKAEPGTYTLEVSYIGYETRKLTGLIVESNELTQVEVTLNSSGGALEECVIKEYKVPLREESHGIEVKGSRTKAKLLGRKKDARRHVYKPRSESMPASVEEPAAPRPKPSKKITDGISVAGAASGEKTRVVSEDKIRVAYDPETYEERIEYVDADLAADDAPIYEASPSDAPKPRAGLLTAGEWNDLHNWNTHWMDLLADGEIDSYQQQYGYYPAHRYTLMVTNEESNPLVDLPVVLFGSKGNVIWEGRTDNTGTVELWAGLHEEEWKKEALSAKVFYKGKKYSVYDLKPANKGINTYQIQAPCGASNNVDIVWAVDATGSMGDELEYLKSELLDVIGRVQSINPDLNIRMGSVFYRDKGDDYIVKSSGLSTDIPQTVEYIRKQSAGGGGDYPEAVHSALDEAIEKQKWSREAVARICFLVLDASPHQEPEVLENIRQSIRKAAEKGIRVVPVSGSGIQKDTEFLMKFFGLATNGSYVFLTDHSGIGGKHIEATTDEYKVEQLNDLLVRLITEYTTVPDCEGKMAIRFEDPQQQNQNAEQALYYPNPSSTQFTLELPFDVEKITLYDAEGKAVRNLASVNQGQHTVQVHDLAPGFYTLRIWKNGWVQSGKVLVVRS